MRRTIPDWTIKARRCFLVLALLVTLSGSNVKGETQEKAILQPEQIMEAFRKVSTGNLSDAVEEATGQRGAMFHDMKPIFKTKIVGRAYTAALRRVFKNDPVPTQTTLCKFWMKLPLGVFSSMFWKMDWRLPESAT